MQEDLNTPTGADGPRSSEGSAQGSDETGPKIRRPWLPPPTFEAPPRRSGSSSSRSGSSSSRSGSSSSRSGSSRTLRASIVDRGLYVLTSWLQPRDRHEKAAPRSQDQASDGRGRGREGAAISDATRAGDPPYADSSTYAGNLAYAEDPAEVEDPTEVEHPAEVEHPPPAGDPTEAGGEAEANDEVTARRSSGGRHDGYISFAGARISFSDYRLSFERADVPVNAPDPILVGLAARRLTPVGWPPRLVAAIIDGSLFVPLYVIAWLTMGDLFEASPALFALALAVVPLVYWTLAEGLTGRTIGKAIMRIRVVGEDGSRLTWRGAIVRNLFRYATHAVPFAEVVTLLAIITSPRDQRIGDLVAHTVVVRREASAGDQDPRGDPVEVRRGRAPL